MLRIHHEDLDPQDGVVPPTTDRAVLQCARNRRHEDTTADDDPQHEREPRQRGGIGGIGGTGSSRRTGGNDKNRGTANDTTTGRVRWRDDLPASFGRIRNSKDYDELHVNFCQVGNFLIQLMCESIWTRPVSTTATSSSTSSLRSVELFECQGLNDVAIQALAGLVACNAPLERLCVQHGLLPDTNVEPLLEALATNTRLRELKIRAGSLPIRIGPKAAWAIGQSKTLVNLTLSGMDINLQGMELLALQLRSNDRLESLELASALTRIPSKTFLELVTNHNWRLETVYLQGVPDREHDQIVQWASQRNRHVRRAVLAWENVTRIGRLVVGPPAVEPDDLTVVNQVLRLLPQALRSLKSKPTLAHRLLRDKHLDDLVVHWQTLQQQKQQTQTAATTTTTRKKPTRGRAVYSKMPPPPPASPRRRYPLDRSG